MSLIKRAIAIILCTALIGDPVWATGVSDMVRSNFSSDIRNVQIPSRLGMLSDKWFAPKPSYVVVLIQDLHANIGVQKNIAGIIEFLHRRTKLNTIFSEAAFGPCDVSVLRSLPTRRAQKKLENKLLSKALLAGDELAAINIGDGPLSPVKLIGVDDPMLYLANVQAFRELISNGPRIIKEWTAVRDIVIPGAAPSLKRHLELTEKMLSLKLVDHEWEQYKLHKDWTPGRNREGKKGRRGEKDSSLANAISAAERFYTAAEARNNAMTDNVLGSLKPGAPVALVTGGFHSASIAHALKQKGVSFVVITPRVERLDQEELYQESMAEPPHETVRAMLGSGYNFTPMKSLMQSIGMGIRWLSKRAFSHSEAVSEENPGPRKEKTQYGLWLMKTSPALAKTALTIAFTLLTSVAASAQEVVFSKGASLYKIFEREGIPFTPENLKQAAELNPDVVKTIGSQAYQLLYGVNGNKLVLPIQEAANAILPPQAISSLSSTAQASDMSHPLVEGAVMVAQQPSLLPFWVLGITALALFGFFVYLKRASIQSSLSARFLPEGSSLRFALDAGRDQRVSARRLKAVNVVWNRIQKSSYDTEAEAERVRQALINLVAAERAHLHKAGNMARKTEWINFEQSVADAKPSQSGRGNKWQLRPVEPETPKNWDWSGLSLSGPGARWRVLVFRAMVGVLLAAPAFAAFLRPLTVPPTLVQEPVVQEAAKNLLTPDVSRVIRAPRRFARAVMMADAQPAASPQSLFPPTQGGAQEDRGIRIESTDGKKWGLTPGFDQDDVRLLLALEKVSTPGGPLAVRVRMDEGHRGEILEEINDLETIDRLDREKRLRYYLNPIAGEKTDAMGRGRRVEEMEIDLLEDQRRTLQIWVEDPSGAQSELLFGTNRTQLKLDETRLYQAARNFMRDVLKVTSASQPIELYNPKTGGKMSGVPLGAVVAMGDAQQPAALVEYFNETHSVKKAAEEERDSLGVHPNRWSFLALPRGIFEIGFYDYDRSRPGFLKPVRADQLSGDSLKANADVMVLKHVRNGQKLSPRDPSNPNDPADPYNRPELWDRVIYGDNASEADFAASVMGLMGAHVDSANAKKNARLAKIGAVVSMASAGSDRVARWLAGKDGKNMGVNSAWAHVGAAGANLGLSLYSAFTGVPEVIDETKFQQEATTIFKTAHPDWSDDFVVAQVALLREIVRNDPQLQVIFALSKDRKNEFIIKAIANVVASGIQLGASIQDVRLQQRLREAQEVLSQYINALDHSKDLIDLTPEKWQDILSQFSADERAWFIEIMGNNFTDGTPGGARYRPFDPTHFDSGLTEEDMNAILAQIHLLTPDQRARLIGTDQEPGILIRLPTMEAGLRAQIAEIYKNEFNIRKWLYIIPGKADELAQIFQDAVSAGILQASDVPDLSVFTSDLPSLQDLPENVKAQLIQLQITFSKLAASQQTALVKRVSDILAGIIPEERIIRDRLLALNLDFSKWMLIAPPGSANANRLIELFRQAGLTEDQIPDFSIFANAEQMIRNNQMTDRAQAELEKFQQAVGYVRQSNPDLFNETQSILNQITPQELQIRNQISTLLQSVGIRIDTDNIPDTVAKLRDQVAYALGRPEVANNPAVRDEYLRLVNELLSLHKEVNPNGLLSSYGAVGDDKDVRDALEDQRLLAELSKLLNGLGGAGSPESIARAGGLLGMINALPRGLVGVIGSPEKIGTVASAVSGVDKILRDGTIDATMNRSPIKFNGDLEILRAIGVAMDIFRKPRPGEESRLGVPIGDPKDPNNQWYQNFGLTSNIFSVVRTITGGKYFRDSPSLADPAAYRLFIQGFPWQTIFNAIYVSKFQKMMDDPKYHAVLVEDYRKTNIAHRLWRFINPNAPIIGLSKAEFEKLSLEAISDELKDGVTSGAQGRFTYFRDRTTGKLVFFTVASYTQKAEEMEKALIRAARYHEVETEGGTISSFKYEPDGAVEFKPTPAGANATARDFADASLRSQNPITQLPASYRGGPAEESNKNTTNPYDISNSIILLAETGDVDAAYDLSQNIMGRHYAHRQRDVGDPNSPLAVINGLRTDLEAGGVTDGSVSTGPNARLSTALLRLRARLRDPKKQEILLKQARQLADFIGDAQRRDGSIPVGFDGGADKNTSNESHFRDMGMFRNLAAILQAQAEEFKTRANRAGTIDMASEWSHQERQARKQAKKFAEHAERLKAHLKTQYDPIRGYFVMGSADGNVDRTYATDVNALAILTLGPIELDEWLGAGTTEKILNSLQDSEVTLTLTSGDDPFEVVGHDATDADGRRASGDRPALIVPELTSHVASAYQIAAAFYSSEGDAARARTYLERAQRLTQNLDRLAVRTASGASLPYAVSESGIASGFKLYPNTSVVTPATVVSEAGGLWTAFNIRWVNPERVGLDPAAAAADLGIRIESPAPTRVARTTLTAESREELLRGAFVVGEAPLADYKALVRALKAGPVPGKTFLSEIQGRRLIYQEGDRIVMVTPVATPTQIVEDIEKGERSLEDIKAVLAARTHGGLLITYMENGKMVFVAKAGASLKEGEQIIQKEFDRLESTKTDEELEDIEEARWSFEDTYEGHPDARISIVFPAGKEMSRTTRNRLTGELETRIYRGGILRDIITATTITHLDITERGHEHSSETFQNTGTLISPKQGPLISRSQTLRIIHSDVRSNRRIVKRVTYPALGQEEIQVFSRHRTPIASITNRYVVMNTHDADGRISGSIAYYNDGTLNEWEAGREAIISTRVGLSPDGRMAAFQHEDQDTQQRWITVQDSLGRTVARYDLNPGGTQLTPRTVTLVPNGDFGTGVLGTLGVAPVMETYPVYRRSGRARDSGGVSLNIPGAAGNFERTRAPTGRSQFLSITPNGRFTVEQQDFVLGRRWTEEYDSFGRRVREDHPTYTLNIAYVGKTSARQRAVRTDRQTGEISAAWDYGTPATIEDTGIDLPGEEMRRLGLTYGTIVIPVTKTAPGKEPEIEFVIPGDPSGRAPIALLANGEKRIVDGWIGTTNVAARSRVLNRNNELQRTYTARLAPVSRFLQDHPNNPLPLARTLPGSVMTVIEEVDAKTPNVKVVEYRLGDLILARSYKAPDNTTVNTLIYTGTESFQYPAYEVNSTNQVTKRFHVFQAGDDVVTAAYAPDGTTLLELIRRDPLGHLLWEWTYLSHSLRVHRYERIRIDDSREVNADGRRETVTSSDIYRLSPNELGLPSPYVNPYQPPRASSAELERDVAPEPADRSFLDRDLAPQGGQPQGRLIDPTVNDELDGIHRPRLLLNTRNEVVEVREVAPLDADGNRRITIYRLPPGQRYVPRQTRDEGMADYARYLELGRQATPIPEVKVLDALGRLSEVISGDYHTRHIYRENSTQMIRSTLDFRDQLVRTIYYPGFQTFDQALRGISLDDFEASLPLGMGSNQVAQLSQRLQRAGLATNPTHAGFSSLPANQIGNRLSQGGIVGDTVVQVAVVISENGGVSADYRLPNDPVEQLIMANHGADRAINVRWEGRFEEETYKLDTRNQTMARYEFTGFVPASEVVPANLLPQMQVVGIQAGTLLPRITETLYSPEGYIRERNFAQNRDWRDVQEGNTSYDVNVNWNGKVQAVNTRYLIPNNPLGVDIRIDYQWDGSAINQWWLMGTPQTQAPLGILPGSLLFDENGEARGDKRYSGKEQRAVRGLNGETVTYNAYVYQLNDPVKREQRGEAYEESNGRLITRNYDWVRLRLANIVALTAGAETIVYDPSIAQEVALYGEGTYVYERTGVEHRVQTKELLEATFQQENGRFTERQTLKEKEPMTERETKTWDRSYVNGVEQPPVQRLYQDFWSEMKSLTTAGKIAAVSTLPFGVLLTLGMAWLGERRKERSRLKFAALGQPSSATTASTPPANAPPARIDDLLRKGRHLSAEDLAALRGAVQDIAREMGVDNLSGFNLLGSDGAINEGRIIAEIKSLVPSSPGGNLDPQDIFKELMQKLEEWRQTVNRSSGELHPLGDGRDELRRIVLIEWLTQTMNVNGFAAIADMPALFYYQFDKAIGMFNQSAERYSRFGARNEIASKITAEIVALEGYLRKEYVRKRENYAEDSTPLFKRDRQTYDDFSDHFKNTANLLGQSDFLDRYEAAVLSGGLPDFFLALTPKHKTFDDAIGIMAMIRNKRPALSAIFMPVAAVIIYPLVAQTVGVLTAILVVAPLAFFYLRSMIYLGRTTPRMLVITLPILGAIFYPLVAQMVPLYMSLLFVAGLFVPTFWQFRVLGSRSNNTGLSDLVRSQLKNFLVYYPLVMTSFIVLTSYLNDHAWFVIRRTLEFGIQEVWMWAPPMTLGIFSFILFFSFYLLFTLATMAGAAFSAYSLKGEGIGAIKKWDHIASNYSEAQDKFTKVMAPPERAAQPGVRQVIWDKFWKEFIEKHLRNPGREDYLITEAEKQMLLTLPPSDWTPVADPEAQWRIQRAIESAMMPMPHAQSWDDMESLSVVMTGFGGANEPAYLPFKNMNLPDDPGGYTQLNKVIWVYPHNWRTFANSFDEPTRTILLAHLVAVAGGNKSLALPDDLSPEVKKQVEIWFSTRTQPLEKTVREIAIIREAYLFHAALHFPDATPEELGRLVDDKLQIFINYNSLGMQGLDAKGNVIPGLNAPEQIERIRALMKEFPYMHWRSGRDTVVQGSPDNVIGKTQTGVPLLTLAQGRKTFAQNEVMPFVKYNKVLFFDVNASVRWEEAIKLPLSLAEFRQDPQLKFVLFGENIYNRPLGWATDAVGLGEETWTQDEQEFLSMFGALGFYGHSAIVDRQALIAAGGIPHEFSGEDTIMTIKFWLEGYRTLHRNYILFGKSRWASFGQGMAPTGRWSQNVAEYDLSRWMHRLVRSDKAHIAMQFIIQKSLGFFPKKPLIPVLNDIYNAFVILLGVSGSIGSGWIIFLGVVGLILNQGQAVPALIHEMQRKGFWRGLRDYGALFPASYSAFVPIITNYGVRFYIALEHGVSGFAISVKGLALKILTFSQIYYGGDAVDGADSDKEYPLSERWVLFGYKLRAERNELVQAQQAAKSAQGDEVKEAAKRVKAAKESLRNKYLGRDMEVRIPFTQERIGIGRLPWGMSLQILMSIGFTAAVIWVPSDQGKSIALFGLAILQNIILLGIAMVYRPAAREIWPGFLRGKPKDGEKLNHEKHSAIRLQMLYSIPMMARTGLALWLWGGLLDHRYWWLGLFASMATYWISAFMWQRRLISLKIVAAEIANPGATQKLKWRERGLHWLISISFFSSIGITIAATLLASPMFTLFTFSSFYLGVPFVNFMIPLYGHVRPIKRVMDFIFRRGPPNGNGNPGAAPVPAPQPPAPTSPPIAPPIAPPATPPVSSPSSLLSADQNPDLAAFRAPEGGSVRSERGGKPSPEAGDAPANPLADFMRPEDLTSVPKSSPLPLNSFAYWWIKVFRPETPEVEAITRGLKGLRVEVPVAISLAVGAIWSPVLWGVFGVGVLVHLALQGYVWWRDGRPRSVFNDLTLQVFVFVLYRLPHLVDALMGHDDPLAQAIILAVGSFVGVIHVLNDRLRAAKPLATHDPLTGLQRRDWAEEKVQEWIRYASLSTNPELSLILVDGDRFKDINDRYGSRSGDKILQHITSTIQGALRSPNLVVRWGDHAEEILILLPFTGSQEAQNIAERLRRQVGTRASQVLEGQKISADRDISISLGVASYQPGDTVESLFSRADKALYRAKADGRDRVRVYSSEDAGNPAKPSVSGLSLKAALLERLKSPMALLPVMMVLSLASALEPVFLGLLIVAWAVHYSQLVGLRRKAGEVEVPASLIFEQVRLLVLYAVPALLFGRLDGAASQATVVAVTTLITALVGFYHAFAGREESVKDHATKDKLTGLKKKDAFVKHVADMAALVERKKVDSLTFVILDLADFKRINDTFGHDAGDEVLKFVAAKFSNAFPDNPGLAGRIGGNVFALLLPNVSPADAHSRMEALKRELLSSQEKVGSTHEARDLGISAHVSVIRYGDHDVPATFFERAKSLAHREKEATKQAAQADPISARSTFGAAVAAATVALVPFALAYTGVTYGDFSDAAYTVARVLSVLPLFAATRFFWDSYLYRRAKADAAAGRIRGPDHLIPEFRDALDPAEAGPENINQYRQTMAFVLNGRLYADKAALSNLEPTDQRRVLAHEQAHLAQTPGARWREPRAFWAQLVYSLKADLGFPMSPARGLLRIFIFAGLLAVYWVYPAAAPVVGVSMTFPFWLEPSFKQGAADGPKEMPPEEHELIRQLATMETDDKQVSFSKDHSESVALSPLPVRTVKVLPWGSNMHSVVRQIGLMGAVRRVQSLYGDVFEQVLLAGSTLSDYAYENSDIDVGLAFRPGVPGEIQAQVVDLMQRVVQSEPGLGVIHLYPISITQSDARSVLQASLGQWQLHDPSNELVKRYLEAWQTHPRGYPLQDRMEPAYGVSPKVKANEVLTLRSYAKYVDDRVEFWSDRTGAWKAEAAKPVANQPGWHEVQVPVKRSFHYGFRMTRDGGRTYRYTISPQKDGRVLMEGGPAMPDRPRESSLRSGKVSVLMVAMESAYKKVGGEGDYVRDVPTALADDGHMSQVVTPLYNKHLPKGLKAEETQTLDLPVNGGHVSVRVHKVKVSPRKYYYFVEDPDDVLFHRTGKQNVYYQADSLRGVVETVVLDQAACFIPGVFDIPVDVVHANDWQTGLVPVYMRNNYKGIFDRTAIAYITHNISYQGVFPRYLSVDSGDPVLAKIGGRAPIVRRERGRVVVDTHALLGIAPELLHSADKGLEWYSRDSQGRVTNAGQIALGKGFRFADVLTGVSETNMAELDKPVDQGGVGSGLEGLVAWMKSEGRAEAIFNGTDQSPSTDPDLTSDGYVQFHEDDADALAKKLQNKRAFNQEHSLDMADSDFLVTSVIRITDQKGADLLANAIEEVSRWVPPGKKIVFAILGTPEENDAQGRAMAAHLHEVATRSGVHLKFFEKFDSKIANRMYAAGDLFAMPSRREPAGIAQQIANKYGAPVIAYLVGGLVDFFKRWGGVGYALPADRTVHSLVGGILQAADDYWNRRDEWDQKVLQAMHYHASWKSRIPLLVKNVYLRSVRRVRGIKEKRVSALSRTQVVRFMERNRLEVGLHTHKGGKAYEGVSIIELVRYAEVLIQQKILPALDQVRVIEMLRANPRNREAPLAFLFGEDQDQAILAAEAGANVLIGTGFTPQFAARLRERFPDVVLIGELSHTSVHLGIDIFEFERSRLDGMMLKRWADWKTKFADGPYAIKKLHKKFPDQVLFVAGGVFETTVSEALSNPPGVVAAVGVNAKGLEAFRKQVAAYVQVVRPGEQELVAEKSRSTVRLAWLGSLLYSLAFVTMGMWQNNSTLIFGGLGYLVASSMLFGDEASFMSRHGLDRLGTRDSSGTITLAEGMSPWRARRVGWHEKLVHAVPGRNMADFALAPLADIVAFVLASFGMGVRQDGSVEWPDGLGARFLVQSAA